MTIGVEITAPVVNVNVSDPVINADPWPYIEEWRKTAPAVFNTATNSWMVTGYDDVRRIYANDQVFEHDNDTFNAAFGGRHLSTLRKPLHGAVRGVFRPHLQREVLIETSESMVDDLVAQYLGDVAERVRAGETVDVVPAFQRISTWVVLKLLAIEETTDPEIDVKFRRWSDDMSGHVNSFTEKDVKIAEAQRARGVIARKEAHAYSEQLLVDRAENPLPHDMIHDLAVSGMDHPIIDESSPLFGMAEPILAREDMRALVANFVGAAQTNVVNTMAAVTLHLSKHPEDKQALIDDAELIPGFLEETFRYNATLMTSPRVVARGSGDVNVGGVVIPEGDLIFPLNGAANRDPARWDDPHRFDMRREIKSHMTFGFGPHSCLGVSVARMECRQILLGLLDMMPDYDIAASEIPYGNRFMARGPKSVPVRAKEK